MYPGVGPAGIVAITVGVGTAFATVTRTGADSWSGGALGAGIAAGGGAAAGDGAAAWRALTTTVSPTAAARTRTATTTTSTRVPRRGGPATDPSTQAGIRGGGGS